MKLSKHYPHLKNKPSIKAEIMRRMREYSRTKVRGGEYNYFLFLDVAKKYDVNYQKFNQALFELIREKKIAMNERGFCVKRELN